MKKIKLMILAITVGFAVTILSGCASDNLKAPCPNYGSSCHKTPINSWNYPRN